MPESLTSIIREHFGFSADKNKNILNKNTVFCNLCFKSYVYSQSTGSLHLKSSHREVLENRLVLSEKSSRAVNLFPFNPEKPVTPLLRARRTESPERGAGEEKIADNERDHAAIDC